MNSTNDKKKKVPWASGLALVWIIIVIVWVIAGLAAIIKSLTCLSGSKSGGTGEKVGGLFVSFFLGPFYWLYYGLMGSYCRDIPAAQAVEKG